MTALFIGLGFLAGVLAMIFGLCLHDGAAAAGFAVAAGLCILAASVAHLACAIGCKKKE